ncbi:hypothetical protein H0H87_008390 [Tephrocybe sp. NHM501043]|nr:hypothetical protein H0H87_008390 [Tephrocybe sp. NHM501043]
MFNAPRPAQRYAGTSSTAGFGGSFVDENPLANSVYDDGLDPWSAAPSPSPTPIPRNTSSVFSSVIADATVPNIYTAAFTAVDPANLGEASVNSLSRVLSTSGLPAATIDKVIIVNLVSSKPRVSKLEFFVALALVALAQAGKDVSIEQVAALSSQNTLPEPALDLSQLQPSTSTFAPPTPSYRQNSINVDPWNTNPRFGPPPASASGFDNPRGGLMNGAPSSLAGTGLPNEWWRKQEIIRVNLLGPQGFILNRYMVYEVVTDRGPPPVHRRYSEFVFLWDVLLRRYPFRLFPALPPKRVGGDEHFLEQRRRGLARALNFIINHPILKDDGLLAVFLMEPSFEMWRKYTPVSLDEESTSKRVDRIEEMTIPSDLEDKIAYATSSIRHHCILNHYVDQAQRDLYLATRDLLIRHDRLSIDQVERLKKRAETTSLKLDGIRAAQKEGWEEEVDRLTGLVEKDQATIAAQLSRRVFIRASMWHELRVVLHNRENTLLTQLVHKFSREEREFTENVLNNWVSFGEAVEGMPYE